MPPSNFGNPTTRPGAVTTAVSPKNNAGVRVAASGGMGLANTKKDRVRIRIGDRWYDVTNWDHPGGAAILKQMNGTDATDAFYALHSADAHARLAKLGGVPCTPEECDVKNTAPELRAFRQFRQQLVDEGWWNRSVIQEAWLLGMVWGLFLLGSYLATYTSHHLIAIGVLGLAMQQAGWLGHDFQHGRGGYCWWVGHAVACWINAFSPTWWSDKHNTHHVFPNFHGVDQDIALDPVFHLWIPAKNKDVFMRKYQHWYFLPVCSFIYVSWRMQSFQWAWAKKNYFELGMQFVNYCWLLLVLPWYVSLGSIMLGGWLVGVVVTASHQSEQMTSKAEHDEYNYVKHQFDSTRNADTSGWYNIFMHYIWGGMQFQLEHHLFPTMPRYYYTALSARVKEFARANNLDYRAEGTIKIWSRLLETMRYYGTSEAQHHAQQSGLPGTAAAVTAASH